MSDLTGLNIDAEIQEQDGSGGRTLVPRGKYRSVMVFESVNDNKAKNGKIFEVRWQIVDGQHADTILRDWLNIVNPNKISQDIGQGTLKRICRLTGVPFPPPDTSLMFGKPCLLTVNVKPDYKDKTKFQNEITAYNPVPADFIPADNIAVPETTLKNAEDEAKEIIDAEW